MENVLKKIIFDSLYAYLTSKGLITKNQSGFVLGGSCINQLLFLINEIHKAFENPKSLEVTAIFLIDLFHPRVTYYRKYWSRVTLLF